MPYSRKGPDLDDAYDKIYRYCYFKVRHRQIAEDITQQTFLNLFEYEKKENVKNPLAFLYTVAGNLCMDEFRRQKRETLEENDTLIWKEPEAIWALSSVMPFLALTIISEWMRSMAYGMFELEQATRFSFKSVVLARLGILGIVNFLLFLFCLFLGGMQSDTELLKAAVYLATPYLATVFLGLWVMRKTGFRESEYVCLGIAVAVSALGILMRLSAKILLSAEAVKWWGLLAVILLALVIEEFCNGLKKTEAYIWN